APAPPSGDRFGPNNTQQTATELGSITSQKVFPKLFLPPGHSDEFFRLEAGASGQLIVSVTPAIAGTPLQVELLDAGGHVLHPLVTNVLDQSGVVVGQQFVISVHSGDAVFVHVSGTSDAGILYSLSAQALTLDFGTQVEGGTTDSLSFSDQK